jgi:hypothetical protein
MFVKLSFFKPIYLIIPIILVGMVVFLKSSRSWKGTFADFFQVFKLLVKILNLAVSAFCAVVNLRLKELWGVQDFQGS